MLKELREVKSVAEANELLGSGEWVCLNQHVINDSIVYILGRYDFSKTDKTDYNLSKKSKKYSYLSALPSKKL